MLKMVLRVVVSHSVTQQRILKIATCLKLKAASKYCAGQFKSLSEIILRLFLTEIVGVFMAFLPLLPRRNHVS